MDYELRAARARREALRKANGYIDVPLSPKPQRMTRQERAVLTAIRKQEREQQRKQLLWQIAQRILTVVSSCVPDGDPIDYLVPFVQRLTLCERHEVTKWLNAACRAHLDCRTYNLYLIYSWDGWNEVCEPDQRMDNPWRPRHG